MRREHFSMSSIESLRSKFQTCILIFFISISIFKILTPEILTGMPSCEVSLTHLTYRLKLF